MSKFKKAGFAVLALLLLAVSVMSGCSDGSAKPGTAAPAANDAAKGKKKLKIGVSFETLQTSYWVVGFNAIKKDIQDRGYDVVEAIADGDSNRQLEQVKNFIAQKVDGIIIVPKDEKTIIPMIKAANDAKIPIVLYNRPPAKTDAVSTTVVADNKKITAETVQYMVDQARKQGGKYKAMILIGDLGDQNGIARRDGFLEVVEKNKDIIDVVAKVPTEWNQEKALAGVTNALQANPDINFVFSSTDFLFPSLVSALKAANKYKKIGEPGHVILGGFDGDDTAYKMLKDNYLDADGVQDVYFESKSAVQAVVDMLDGKKVQEFIYDPGFVIHQGNLKEKEAQMWGSSVK
ncbi:sugar ABC transporter substrate-binding protein [Paenibacillus thalictri]|uniref:Sugar ABC transporter substrate-binding protein n=1 Tax=Paenibacillus thalictri TaxID=2527873 RepID=A0A4Q9DPH7_9BACL|nr:sugar ABC transporter substrate-binding protein [Paenibacillus thalictri]TBL76538.1 sugar ABC transporter substrate-binding protein [Paenibacillus thalictri]